MTSTQYDIAIQVAKRQFPHLGNGWDRSVFDMGDGFVLKLPLHRKGEINNRHEVNIFETSQEPIYAQCRLIEFHGVEAVIMEKVTVDIFGYRLPHDERPDWIKWIDSGQVGWTVDGRLVAFDFP